MSVTPDDASPPVLDRPRLLSLRNGEKLTPNFSREEMDRRLSKLRSWMQEASIDVCLFTSIHNVNYFAEHAPEHEVALHATRAMVREIARRYPQAELMDTWAWFQSGINTDGAHNPVTTRRPRLFWYHMAIPDMSAPGTAFDEAWSRDGARILESLRDGGRLVVHCAGGRGRPDHPCATGGVKARPRFRCVATPARA